jgi:HIRAN domain
MRIFHRHARRQDVEYHQLPPATPDEQHAWLRDYVVLPGHHDLDVVGESHYQEDLWRAANGQIGSAERVRADVTAVLAAEDDNPYDDNAVSVWVHGRKVGYLPADIARRYRPGLLNAQAAAGKSVALPGVIVGGGLDDAGGQRMLGIFLRHDPVDFGLRRPHLVITFDASMRTALCDAMATDEDDDSYDLGWRDRLPGDDIKAIPALRQLLANETEPISRHFECSLSWRRSSTALATHSSPRSMSTTLPVGSTMPRSARYARRCWRSGESSRLSIPTGRWLSASRRPGTIRRRCGGLSEA